MWKTREELLAMSKWEMEEYREFNTCILIATTERSRNMLQCRNMYMVFLKCCKPDGYAEQKQRSLLKIKKARISEEEKKKTLANLNMLKNFYANFNI